MRAYEDLFIARPDAPEEEIDAFVDQMKQVITSGGGTVEKADKWGVRKLAYRIGKRDEGFYVLLQYTSGPDVVRELERRFRVSDLIVKFLTVRIDERLKKIEKRRKEREKRARRKPQPVTAPAAPAPAAPASPAAPAGPGRPVAEMSTAEAGEPAGKE